MKPNSLSLLILDELYVDILGIEYSKLIHDYLPEEADECLHYLESNDLIYKNSEDIVFITLKGREVYEQFI